MSNEHSSNEKTAKETLPVDAVLETIVRGLRSAGALVLKAEPGAGKTTRVPPAILDAGLAELDDGQSGKTGQIVLLQPRRIAARAAASRMSEERGTELGQEIGYQVRFEKRSSRNTRILVCTEGVFLRRMQDDPFLENTAMVIFDEFHERSVDSDLALALVRQVREQLRPDLRILVMSATLNSEPIAQYLGGCPIVECPGRVHPVDIEYLQYAPSAKGPIDGYVSEGVKQILKRSTGDVLVFLPGVGEIRQTSELLESTAHNQDCILLQLYGDLPLEEQRQVLQPNERRKIILSTNVAETSLTIDGVTAVVDSGLARVNRLDLQLGLNRLQVERISRASAEQRAGRAGRNQAGSCLRLWTERDQFAMRDFELPEIARVELSQCLLQLLVWGEKDLRSFPWFEKPPEQAFDQALTLLEQLDAISENGLTELGKQMATLPLQPRLARLIVEGERLGCTKRAALCAALLSERDPFRRPAPQFQAQQFQAQHHSDSDVLDRLIALEDFAETGNRSSYCGDIIPGAAKQVLRAAEQLMRSNHKSASLGNQKPQLAPGATDDAILRTLLAAFPDRVCKRREAGGRRAVMVGGRGVKLADESSVAEGELFVAVELMDSGKSESVVRKASSIERSWLPASHFTTRVDVIYDSEREKVMAFKRSKFCGLLLDENPTQIPADTDIGTVLANELANRSDLSTLVDEEAKQYLLRLQCLREWIPQLELPDFGSDPWKTLLPEWCAGCSSLAELRTRSLVPAMQSRLTYKQISDLEVEAPAQITLKNGRTHKLVYVPGQAPVLAARIQEFFGTRETPRIAGSRISVLLHLLAPNYRVQQITPDLASFWKNTYEDVRKELKGRYPKHAWPQDPLIPLPERGPKK